jgi:hypothetical protein
MSTAYDLLDRCAQAGVRLTLCDGGRGLRYDAPGGLDPALKADLRAHKVELILLLAKTDAPDQGQHPDPTQVAEPPVATDAGGQTAGRLPGRGSCLHQAATGPSTVILVRGSDREIVHLPPGVPVPAEAVLWTQRGTVAYWWPGPAHSLFDELIGNLNP